MFVPFPRNAIHAHSLEAMMLAPDAKNLTIYTPEPAFGNNIPSRKRMSSLFYPSVELGYESSVNGDDNPPLLKRLIRVPFFDISVDF
jgi:hypothetical protein